MLCQTNLDTLSDGVAELYNRGKISSTVQTDLITFIGTLTDQNYFLIPFTGFNQNNSTGVVFDNPNRKVTNIGAAVVFTTQITNLITGKEIVLFRPKYNSTAATPVISYAISYDQVNWYTLAEEPYEKLTADTFYIRLTYSTASVELTGLYILYK